MSVFSRSNLFSFCLVGCLAAGHLTGCQSADPPAEQTPAEPPLFTRLMPAASGLTFSNDIVETNQINILTYEYLYLGAGVAVGDVNHDSLPDLFFSGTMVPNRLYLNRGDLRFEDVTDSAGVAGPPSRISTGVTMVDINQDGYLDIYVCQSGKFAPDQRRNLLYINNGDATFSEQATAYGLDDPSPSTQATFFDYDRDGDLDLYLLNHPDNFREINTLKLYTPDRRTVSDRLYQNNGNNTFTDVTEAAGVYNYGFGLSATVGDLNNDGWPDLYIANDYIEPDFLYINNGNGTFTDRIDDYMDHMPYAGMGSDIADINNDGLLDVMVLDMLAEANRRQKLLVTSMEYERYNLQVKYGYKHQITHNMLHLNNGNGHFSEIARLAGVSTTDWSWAALFADFDSDGFRDLFITNGIRRDVTNMDYIKFTVDSVMKAGGQVTLTNLMEIIPSEKVPNYLYQNNGELTFSNQTGAWGMGQLSFSNGAVYADLDRDGDLDLVINNIDEPAFLFRNNSDQFSENRTLQVRFVGEDQNRDGIGARVNIRTSAGIQVHENIPTRGYMSAVEPLLYFGLGSTQVIDEVRVTWPAGKTQRFQNVPTDQTLVLYERDATQTAPEREPTAEALFEISRDSYGLDFVHQENIFDDFERDPLLPHQLSRLGPALSAGDVNGDGLDDVFIGGAAGSASALYLQNVQGRFSQSRSSIWLQDAAFEDVGSTFFDADGDLDLDLYVVSGGNAFPAGDPVYQDRLYFNDGTGSFTRTDVALPEMYVSGSCVTAGDYDGDGDQDLFVGGRVIPGTYPLPPRSYLLRNDGGTFTDVTTDVAPALEAPGLVTSAIWHDYDGNGTLDLIVVGEWMPISVFKNEAGRFTNATEAAGLSHTSGWWNRIAGGDFDGDGDTDFAAGNLGLNARFKGTPERPVSIFAKDFDGNNRLDAIMTMFYKEGRAFPVHRRDLLIRQLPYIQQRFPRYTSYATAGITDLFPTQELSNALVLQSGWFETSYIENLGNGTFDVKPFPIETQVSPVYGLLVEDFNSDGHLDLMLGGNHFSAEVETARYDAGQGLYLQGDGTGGFVAVPPLQSHVDIPGETRGMILLSRSGNRPDLVLAARNNANVWILGKTVR